MEYKYSPRNGGELYFDIEGVSLEYPVSEYEHLLYFPIVTYTKLRKKEADVRVSEWHDILNVVNSFFVSLTPNDKSAVARTIITMHAVLRDGLANRIMDTNVEEILPLMRELGGIFKDLELEIGLADKLKAFVIKNVPLGDFKNAGRRPQDTPELTFLEDEVAELTVIAVLCKMLLPIFSAFIQGTKSYLDNNVKERHCATILTKFIKYKYHKLFNKLQGYIVHNVSGKFNESTSSIFNAKTKPGLAQFLMDNLLVRNLVNVNLYFTDGHLMTYILVTTKKSINTQESNIRGKSFLDKNTFSDDDEEGNQSNFEQDTLMSSKKTCDTVGLVTMVTHQKCMELLKFYQLDVKEWQGLLDFYASNLFQVTNFNNFMTCMYFSQLLGGSQSIFMLEYIDYCKIVSLLQLICSLLGHHDSAHMLTATPVSSTVLDAKEDGVKLKLGYKSSVVYQRCKTRYEDVNSLGGKKWDEIMQNIVGSITEIPWVYNSAPLIWQRSSAPNLNRKRVVVPDNIIEELCIFIDGNCRI